MVLLVNKVVIIIIMMSNRPYSPDLNPIEEAFGYGWAKLWMKRNNIFVSRTLDDALR